jgi:hypothetical protein
MVHKDNGNYMFRLSFLVPSTGWKSRVFQYTISYLKAVSIYIEISDSYNLKMAQIGKPKHVVIIF